MLKPENIKLLHQWIMVKEHSLQQTTESGLVYNLLGVHGVAGMKAEYFHGTVVAVSDKVKTVKVGDTVIFDCYSGGYDLDLDFEEFFITKPDNIWGVLEV